MNREMVDLDLLDDEDERLWLRRSSRCTSR